MQSSLSAVVIGGLTFSTVLTLVIVPVMYYILDDLQEKVRGRLFKSNSKTTSLEGERL